MAISEGGPRVAKRNGRDNGGGYNPAKKQTRAERGGRVKPGYSDAQKAAHKAMKESNVSNTVPGEMPEPRRPRRGKDSY